MPKKKTTATKYPTITPEQAKDIVVRFYRALQLEWSLELQNEPTDWTHLVVLHYQLADLERRAPWLRQEVPHETR